jgi:hypothetical protein
MLKSGAGSIPEEIYRKDDGGGQCGDWLGRQRSSKKYQVVSVPGTLDPPTMPLPGNAQVSRAAIPGVFSRKYLFRTGGKSADEGIGEKCIASFS